MGQRAAHLPASDADPRLQATRRIGILLVSRGLVVALQVVTLSLLGRRLGPASFGVLQVTWALVMYLTLATDLGLAIVGTREVAAGRQQVVAGILVGLRILLAVIGCAVLAGIAIAVGVTREEGLLLAALAISVIASAVSTRWLAQGLERFVLIGVADVVGASAQLVVAFLLVTDPGSLVAAGLALSSAPLTTAIVLLIGTSHRRLLVPRLGRGTVTLFRTALPLGIAALAIQLYSNADTIVLAVVNGLEQAGWYSAASRVVMAALALPVAANAVVLPMLARMLGQRSPGVRPLLASTTQVLLFASVLFALVCTFRADAIVQLLYGDAFAPAAVPLRLLSWVLVTASANAPFAALVLARGQDRQYLIVTVAGSVLNLVLILAFVPLYGMVGAAVSALAREVLVLGLLWWLARDLAVPIIPPLVRRLIAPAVAAAVAMTIATDWVAGGALGVLVYCIVGVMTHAVPAREVLRALWRGT